MKKSQLFEKVQSLLTPVVDQVCTFTLLKLIVQDDTQIFVFLYNLYVLTSDRCCRGRCCTLPEVYAHHFGLVGIEDQV
jgi:hypothetical protein